MKAWGRAFCLLTVWQAFLLSMVLTVRAEDGAYPAMPPSPPILRVAKPPVERFRELLKMNPGERLAALTNSPTQWQEKVLAKLREYDEMPPEKRELKLQQTQLRWLLIRAVLMPPERRQNLLEKLDPGDRELLAQRLEQWDKLPPEIQKEVLNYQSQVEKASESQTPQVAANVGARDSRTGIAMPPDPPPISNGLANFLQLPRDQRLQVLVSYQKFFQLSEDEKQKVLAEMNDSQRRMAREELQKISGLSPGERIKVLTELGRIASMGRDEQEAFLQNSQVWQAIPQDQREAWRKLASKSPSLPPIPPGLVVPPLPPPSVTAQIRRPGGGGTRQ